MFLKNEKLDKVCHLLASMDEFKGCLTAIRQLTATFDWVVAIIHDGSDFISKVSTGQGALPDTASAVTENQAAFIVVRKQATSQKYCTSACKVAAYRARGADKAATARYRERQKAKQSG